MVIFHSYVSLSEGISPYLVKFPSNFSSHCHPSLQISWSPQISDGNLRYPLVMTNIAIEHGHRNSGFTHWTWWFSIVMLVYQRVPYTTTDYYGKPKALNRPMKTNHDWEILGVMKHMQNTIVPLRTGYIQFHKRQTGVCWLWHWVNHINLSKWLSYVPLHTIFPKKCQLQYIIKCHHNTILYYPSD